MISSGFELTTTRSSAGRLDLVPGAPSGTIAWLRSDGDDRVLVAANLSDAHVEVPTGSAAEALVVTDDGVGLRAGSAAGEHVVSLPPHSAAVLALTLR